MIENHEDSNPELVKRNKKSKDIGVEDFIELSEHIDRITLDLKEF